MIDGEGARQENRRRRRAGAPGPAAWVLFGLLASGTPLYGQSSPDPPHLDVTPGSGELVLNLGDFLLDGSVRSALVSGLPLRIEVSAELWKDGFFDSQVGEVVWRASVIYDPLARSYGVQVGRAPVVSTGSVEAAGGILQRDFEVALRPPEEGRYYYLATLEAETLSLSDLEELQRWLRGELGPAVRGQRDVEGAVSRGFGRLFVRVLGLPVRRVELRTPTFRVRREGSP